MTSTARPDLEGLGSYKFGWADPDVAGASARRGLSEDVVRDISAKKNEPEWMLQRRLKGLELFYKKPMPNWGADLSGIDFDNIKYFVRSTEKQAASWDELPADIKNTYDKLGIPEAEKARLIAGVAAQYESEVVYHKIREDLEEQGVIFLDTDTGLREHEDLFREYFGSVIPAGDNKFAALNTATWSGGSFIYVPKGVHVEIPLQAYFRINTENMGQFERTLIICDEGSSVHYVEGCLPAGQLVATASRGYQPIETIKVGDQVYGDDGRLHRVNAVQARDHRGDLFTFVPVSPANAFTVTEEHPVLAVRRSDVLVRRAPRKNWRPEVDSRKLRAAKPEWIPAKDVVEGDFLVYPKPKPPAPQQVLPLELARLVGYYLAEGHASIINGCQALVFSFHSEEFAYVDEVRQLCKHLYDAAGSVKIDESKHSACVTVYTKAGYRAILDLVGTGSASKQLAPELMAQDDEFLAALVDAYINGDGNRTQRPGGLWTRAHTTSKVWALQLQSIMARLGTFATVELRRPAGPGVILGRDVMRKDLWQVQWTEGATGPKIVRDAGDYYLVPIRKREVAAHSGLVFNLDVEAPDSYLASGFAVHNCTAPVYSSDSLHSAVVEIIVKKNAHCRYTTIQNWSNNVYNLVTKRTSVQAGGRMEWIDGNIGCLVEGSTITTRGGVKPIELVTPGEEVLAYDEASGELCFRRVMGKRYSGEQAVREVRVGERRLVVTDNHPFLAPRADGLLTYVRADAVTDVVVPTSALEYGEPHKLTLPDGSRRESESADLYALGAEVRDGLTEVPAWVVNVPGSQRAAFVDGVLAGRLSVTGSDREQLSHVAAVLTSLGRTGEIVEHNGTYELRVDAPATNTTTTCSAEVSEHLGVLPTWDIEVEGTGNFVSQGFIVHNSKVTMKYPACFLLGEGASGETLSVAFAGEGQHQDAGAKMVHAAPRTSSQIISKSVARAGGRTSYRGLVQVQPGAVDSKATVKCDALLVDAVSRSDTYPYVDVREDDSSIGHEATVSKVGEDMLFYLMSRGISENEAMAMIVRGFVEPIARELPMEYALELNRLIELQMEGAVG